MAYNAIYNFDIICLSESYLNSQIFSNNDKLGIPGYMLRADHPSENRSGEVCIYYKESLTGYIILVTFKNIFALIWW